MGGSTWRVLGLSKIRIGVISSYKYNYFTYRLSINTFETLSPMILEMEIEDPGRGIFDSCASVRTSASPRRTWPTPWSGSDYP